MTVVSWLVCCLHPFRVLLETVPSLLLWLWAQIMRRDLKPGLSPGLSRFQTICSLIPHNLCTLTSIHCLSHPTTTCHIPRLYLPHPGEKVAWYIGWHVYSTFIAPQGLYMIHCLSGHWHWRSTKWNFDPPTQHECFSTYLLHIQVYLPTELEWWAHYEPWWKVSCPLKPQWNQKEGTYLGWESPGTCTKWLTNGFCPSVCLPS